jgi:hypothetical protein
MKTLLTALALATLIAAPALAQTFDRPDSPQAAQRGGQNSVRNNDAVVNGGRVIGRDPDPWIRNEILRHSHSGWPD